MGIVIKVENLGKKYIISHQQERYTALRDVIANTTKKAVKKVIRKSETLPKKEEFWALRNIDFEVNEGDRIGIIGRNGAGKSTLLKLLSRITEPTSGRIKIKGRVASLLEVGTGFHQELTGKENIFLNGAILGMNKKEIQKKFDEIVEFSGIEKFLDTPLKRYSSGMYVRLAFAVAANIEPDILLVDEVLAVGDSEFQKKCLGKMDDISTKEGRTVVFVSHNMGAISKLCKTTMLLDNGKISDYGNTDNIIKIYLMKNLNSYEDKKKLYYGTLNSSLILSKIEINDRINKVIISPSEAININIYGENKVEIPGFGLTLSIFRDGIRLLTIHDLKKPENLPRCKFISIFKIPPFFLRPGEYSIAAGGYCDKSSDWLWGTDLLNFTISEEWDGSYESVNIGYVNLIHEGKRILLK